MLLCSPPLLCRHLLLHLALLLAILRVRLRKVLGSAVNLESRITEPLDPESLDEPLSASPSRWGEYVLPALAQAELYELYDAVAAGTPVEQEEAALSLLYRSLLVVCVDTHVQLELKSDRHHLHVAARLPAIYQDGLGAGHDVHVVQGASGARKP